MVTTSRFRGRSKVNFNIDFKPDRLILKVIRSFAGFVCKATMIFHQAAVLNLVLNDLCQKQVIDLIRSLEAKRLFQKFSGLG